MNPEVDAYIRRSVKWPEVMTDLRPSLLSCGLTEEIKWGKPCYSHEGKNIVILQEMKEFLALMFFKGALLNDPEGVLEEQGPNSRSARRIRFTSVEEVARLTDIVKAFIDEAIQVEAAGLEVGPEPELILVVQLRNRLDQDPALKAAFEALTPGRQREYNLHFSDRVTVRARHDCSRRMWPGARRRESPIRSQSGHRVARSRRCAHSERSSGHVRQVVQGVSQGRCADSPRRWQPADREGRW